LPQIEIKALNPLHTKQLTTFVFKRLLLDAGADPGGAISPSKIYESTKVTLFTVILYNSENNTRD